MKASFLNEIVKPFLVLVVICLAASVLLGATNELTKGVIASNEAKAMEETRRSVLPGAGSFTELEADPALGVDSIFKEDSGLGYVITASHKGYGGNVVVTVGYDNDGKVTGIKADVSTETQGVGSKAGSEQYLSQYLGGDTDPDSVELITSATFSSTAVRESVKAAAAAFEAISGEAK